jgi:hypothetical protein
MMKMCRVKRVIGDAEERRREELVAVDPDVPDRHFKRNALEGSER